MSRLLGLRSEVPEIFALVRYVPLSVRGARAAHVIAFARQYGDMRVIIMAPRAPQDLLADEEALRFDPSRWGATEIALPAEWRSQPCRRWDTDAVTSGPLRASTLLRPWPPARHGRAAGG